MTSYLPLAVNMTISLGFRDIYDVLFGLKDLSAISDGLPYIHADWWVSTSSMRFPVSVLL